MNFYLWRWKVATVLSDLKSVFNTLYIVLRTCSILQNVHKHPVYIVSKFWYFGWHKAAFFTTKFFLTKYNIFCYRLVLYRTTFLFDYGTNFCLYTTPIQCPTNYSLFTCWISPKSKCFSNKQIFATDDYQPSFGRNADISVPSS